MCTTQVQMRTQEKERTERSICRRVVVSRDLKIRGRGARTATGWMRKTRSSPVVPGKKKKLTVKPGQAFPSLTN